LASFLKKISVTDISYILHNCFKTDITARKKKIKQKKMLKTACIYTL